MGYRVILGTVLGGLLGAGLVQESTGEYRDTHYGFRINPPLFSSEDTEKSRLLAAFYAPAEGRYAANMNINVQRPDLSLDDFMSVSRAQFSTAGFEVLDERRFAIGDHGAVEWTYKGKVQDRDMKYIAWAVEREEQIFLITCTSLESSFEKYEAQFKASLESFAFTGTE
jgi:hypothetical protein